MLIYGGVLEKFPKLKIVSAENDVGWMAYFMYRLDTVQNRLGASGGMKLPMRASDYIKRQVFATFISDPVFIDSLHRYGGQHHVVVGLSAHGGVLPAIAGDHGEASRHGASGSIAQDCARHRRQALRIGVS